MAAFISRIPAGGAINPFAELKEAPVGDKTDACSLGPSVATAKAFGEVSTLTVTSSQQAPSFTTLRLKSLPAIGGGSRDRYFEITLTNKVSTPQAAMAVGTVFGEPASRSRMPGWDEMTIAIHSDDAKLYDGSGVGLAVDGLAPFHELGSVLGCGIIETAENIFTLMFTVNGKVVYQRKLAASYPDCIAKMQFAIGLLGPGTAVEVNAGAKPFKLNACNLSGSAPVVVKEDAPAVRPVDKGSAIPDDRIINDVVGVVGNASIRSNCSKHKIDVMSVAWEDTARTKGSCFGPNISDMTLAVGRHSMPIFRKPNFQDLTSDQDIKRFWVVVGNESSNDPSAKKSILLSEYIKDIGKYIDRPSQGSLLLARDSKILTSAQACVLPLRDGRVEFNVKLYNYQSRTEPAVLVIVASSEGTSAQVVLGTENLLRFNKSGLGSDYVAERLSDDRKKRGVPLDGPMTAEEALRNCLLIFQIPLKVKPVARPSGLFGGGGAGFFGGTGIPCAPGFPMSASYSVSNTAPMMCAPSSMRKRSLCAESAAPSRGMEAAMLSTTEGRGKFEGTRGFSLERDEDFPIRCTLQYYHVVERATDIKESHVEAIAAQVNELYDAAAPWNRGSLVTDGDTGRVTEHSSKIGFAESVGALPIRIWGFKI